VTVTTAAPPPPPLPVPPARRRRRWPRVLAGLAVVVVLAGGAAGLWYQRQADPPGPPGAEVQVAIPLGSSTQRIAAVLDDRGVVGSARLFRLWLRVRGEGPFQAGDYRFRQRSSFSQALAVLESGPEVRFDRVTVPEGLTLAQVAERVGRLPGRSAERFLELARSGQVRSRYQPAGSTNLEGLLFPDTYFVEEKDDEAAILARMVATFDQQAAAAGVDQAAARVGLSPYQAIVVASLVERETRFDDERAKVARVVYNRLARRMRLQVDATVIYALGKSGDRNVRVLFRDLEVDSPYNTYKVTGLPPTPIAAPGRASLDAALDPEPGPWLFYVVVETNGRHAFATTGAEHQANIRRAEQNGAR
jgi:UPF0755 protein